MITVASGKTVCRSRNYAKQEQHSHAIWKVIRLYTSNKQKKSIKPANPKILANEFNSYFAGMGNSISESV